MNFYYFPGPGENFLSPKNGLWDLPKEFDKLLLNLEWKYDPVLFIDNFSTPLSFIIKYLHVPGPGVFTLMSSNLALRENLLE